MILTFCKMLELGSKLLQSIKVVQTSDKLLQFVKSLLHVCVCINVFGVVYGFLEPVQNYQSNDFENIQISMKNIFF